MDSMLETTLKLPMISDIAYEIEDMREYFGIIFGQVHNAISDLEATFRKAFDNLHRKLTNQFQWSNLITVYNMAIRQIEYHSYVFEKLPKHNIAANMKAKKLAKAVLRTDGIRKWLHELNFLFTGRERTSLIKHDPLLILFMNR